MKKKTTIFVIAAVLVATLAGAGYAVNGYKCGFDRHGKGFIKERILSRIDYTVQELQLSPAQHTKYSAIRETMSTRMDAMGDRHDAVRDAIQTEMAKADPDIKGMADTVKQEITAMSGAVTTQIDSMVAVYDILDADQKKVFAAKLKDHMDRKCDRRGFNDDD